MVVGHLRAVNELTLLLRRSDYHGMSVVGACLAGPTRHPVPDDIPVFGDLNQISAAVDHFGADTVAVLSCPEMTGVRAAGAEPGASPEVPGPAVAGVGEVLSPGYIQTCAITRR